MGPEHGDIIIASQTLLTRVRLCLQCRLNYNLLPKICHSNYDLIVIFFFLLVAQKSSPKQVSVPVSPPRGRPRKDSKEANANAPMGYPSETPSRTLSSTPHGAQEHRDPTSAVNARTQKVNGNSYCMF